MTAQACIDAIREAVGDKVSDKQMDEMFTLLERRVRRKMKDDPTLAEDRAIREAANDLASEKQLAALIEKRNRAFAVLAKKRRLDFYDQMSTAGLSSAEAIRAMNVGREGPARGTGRSVDAVWHGLEGTLRGAMIGDLEKAGLLKVARMKNPEFELNVAREMARANGDTKVSATGDTHAKAMADIFVKYVEKSRMMQNEAGAFIRKTPGYIVRQAHDQLKINRAGYAEWRSKIIDKLDERTFDNADGDVENFLHDVWANLASGNHQKAGSTSDWLGGFKGPGNLAKKTSAERVLHFKTPEDWLEYNREFGRESLFEAILDNMHFAARNTALMRTWGPNPKAALDSDIEQAIQAAKDKHDIAEADALGSDMLLAEFDEISGGMLVRGSPTRAVWGAGIRSVINMAKLGGVVLSSIPDIGVRAAVLRHNGVPLLESYGRTVSTFMEGRSGSEKRIIGDYLDVGIQGILGETFHRFHATDSIPGTLTKASNVFFKATGLTWWTDSLARGTGLILSREMAGHIGKGKSFGDLNARHRTTLNRYAIGEREWDALSKADTQLADGEHFLMPEAVRELSDDVIKDYLGDAEATSRAIKEARENLATGLSTYYADQVREALTFGGAKERAISTWGGKASGTYAGEAIRFIMQFKQFPITFWTKHVGRELRRGGEVDKMGVAHLAAATTVLGYVAMTAKDYAKGREPRDVSEDPLAITLAAMQQGGGLGIYGDFLFSNANRMGGGVIGTLAGPGAGMFEQYVGVLQAARDGKDPRAKALKATIDSTPFMNIFYARLAFDHMFLHSMQEAVNPGYLRRYQRNIERENNQDFWLPPTSSWGQ